jgi:hypothetical protein
VCVCVCMYVWCARASTSTCDNNIVCVGRGESQQFRRGQDTAIEAEEMGWEGLKCGDMLHTSCAPFLFCASNLMKMLLAFEWKKTGAVGLAHLVRIRAEMDPPVVPAGLVAICTQSTMIIQYTQRRDCETMCTCVRVCVCVCVCCVCVCVYSRKYWARHARSDGNDQLST